MKTIGLLGGMSWESTVHYYQWLNQGAKARLGGLHSAKIVMHSVDFGEVEPLMRREDWDGVADILCAGARSLKAAGADFMLICTNTMHKLAHRVQEAAGMPLLHIADATGERARALGYHTLGLLGTAFTMEQEFYRGRLSEGFGIDVLVPDAPGRRLVHDVIFQELCKGEVLDDSRERYVRIIDGMAADGAQAVVLGCTEIGMLVRPEDTPVPLLDTTRIHVEAALDMAFADD